MNGALANKIVANKSVGIILSIGGPSRSPNGFVGKIGRLAAVSHPYPEK
jgi:hypothetical protein